MARMVIHIAFARELLAAAEIGELDAVSLTHIGQGGANCRIFMPTKRRRFTFDRQIQYFASFSLPLFEKGIHHMNVIAAKVLENPRDHRPVLAFGRVVNYGYSGVAEAGAADPIGELLRRQQRAVGPEGLISRNVDRAR